MDITVKEIRRMLAKMGMAPNLVGFEYCAEAISMVVNDPSLSRHVVKKLYPMIADKLGTTAIAVERGIRHAIIRLYDMSPREQIEIYTVIPIDRSKANPTNTCFVSSIAFHLMDIA